MNYPLLPKQMPERIKNVWRKSALALGGVLTLIGVLIVIAVMYFNGWNIYTQLGATVYAVFVLLVTCGRLLLIPYRYQFHRYEITSEELSFQSGYFFRTTTFVPINRIQHIETEQGPFLRKENLMEVIIHTATTNHHIAGLDVAEAQALREQVIAFVKAAKEDV